MKKEECYRVGMKTIEKNRPVDGAAANEQSKSDDDEDDRDKQFGE